MKRSVSLPKQPTPPSILGSRSKTKVKKSYHSKSELSLLPSDSRSSISESRFKELHKNFVDEQKDSRDTKEAPDEPDTTKQHAFNNEKFSGRTFAKPVTLKKKTRVIKVPSVFSMT